MSDNIVILYFIAYWQDLFSGLSSKRGLLKLFNPRVVVREIYDEVTLNKISNKANEDFFKRTLGDYLKSDPALSMRMKTNMQLMVKEFDLSKHRPRYLPNLCKTVLEQFDNYIYFEDTLSSLISLVNNNQLQEKQKNDLRIICNNLIVELREFGYKDDEIKKIPKNIFSEIGFHNGIPIWDFPHDIVCEDWMDENLRNKYIENLKIFCSNLSVIDRVNALGFFAKKGKEKVRYIFHVSGMTGSEELWVDDVLFYCPLVKRFTKKEEGILDQEISRNNTPYTTPINATVVVESISSTSGEIVARLKVEEALTLCRRIKPNVKSLKLSKSYLALDEKNNKLGSSFHTFEKEDDDFTRCFNVDDADYKNLRINIDGLVKTRKIALGNNWGRRFDESCYWLRKAEESSTDADRLMSYWICIETLCSKSEDEQFDWIKKTESQKETDIFLIREVIGSIVAVRLCYDQVWNLHSHLSSIIFNFFGHGLSVPNDVLQDIQLVEGEISQRAIVENLCKILPYVGDGLLKDQVLEVDLFFKDKHQAIKILRENFKKTQDEIAFIYRMRNKIAHDGNSNHPLLFVKTRVIIDSFFK